MSLGILKKEKNMYLLTAVDWWALTAAAVDSVGDKTATKIKNVNKKRIIPQRRKSKTNYQTFNYQRRKSIFFRIM